eukprot:4701581-Karenia_brevis.AAC.1
MLEVDDKPLYVDPLKQMSHEKFENASVGIEPTNVVREWRNALGLFTLLHQPFHTHFCPALKLTDTNDRIYTSLPGWLLKVISVNVRCAADPVWLHSK